MKIKHLLLTLSFALLSLGANASVVRVLVKKASAMYKELSAVKGMSSQLSKTAESSVAKLTGKDSSSEEELIAAIKGLQNLTATEERTRSRVLETLGKDQGQVSDNEIVQAINGLARLSAKKSLAGLKAQQCTSCVGVKLTAEDMKNVTDAAVQSAYKRLPESSDALKKMIDKNSKRLGLDEISYLEGEEYATALAVELMLNGSEAQKKFGKLYKQIAAEESSSKLHKVFLEVYTTNPSEGKHDELLNGWIELLEDTVSNSKSAGSMKDGFYKSLDERAATAKDPAKARENVETLKAEGCYF